MQPPSERSYVGKLLRTAGLIATTLAAFALTYGALNFWRDYQSSQDVIKAQATHIAQLQAIPTPGQIPTPVQIYPALATPSAAPSPVVVPATPTSMPTQRPTNTPTVRPTNTPVPAATQTPKPANTPTPTRTPIPEPNPLGLKLDAPEIVYQDQTIQVTLTSQRTPQAGNCSLSLLHKDEVKRLDGWLMKNYGYYKGYWKSSPPYIWEIRIPNFPEGGYKLQASCDVPSVSSMSFTGKDIAIRSRR